MGMNDAFESGPTQMAILNPKALVEARKRRGWTQLQLSEATKPQINVSTISRIERGKPSRVRESTVKQFAAALGVQPKDLCEAASPEPDLVKLPMDTGARNALRLVAKRYGVNRRTIIELAPLLFYIAAEQSLSSRRERLKGIREAADTLYHLQCKIQHLPPHWPVDEGALSLEHASIEARDLFGRKLEEGSHPFLNDFVEAYDVAEHNPFAAFLNEALSAARGPKHPDEGYGSVQCAPLGGPSYGICHDEAAEIVGGDQEAAIAIVHGRVALHEMPKGTPAEMAQWARRPLIQFSDISGPNLEHLFTAPDEEPMP
jgi:transcriptional regulator with XRE-family HTH domain